MPKSFTNVDANARTGLNDERSLTETYKERKARKAAEKARLDAMNPLQRMTIAYTGDDAGRYDANVIAANKAHKQYTIWQFQQFQCGHRAGMLHAEMAGYLKLGNRTMHNFRVWLDLPKRAGGKKGSSVKQVNVSVRFWPKLLNAAQERALEQHMTFPVYLRRLIEADLAAGGEPP